MDRSAHLDFFLAQGHLLNNLETCGFVGLGIALVFGLEDSLVFGTVFIHVSRRVEQLMGEDGNVSALTPDAMGIYSTRRTRRPTRVEKKKRMVVKMKQKKSYPSYLVRLRFWRA